MPFRTTTPKVTLACAAALSFGALSARAELDTIQLEVIVGNHTDPWTTEYQIPFFTEWLSERSGGNITAHAVP